MLNLQFMDCVVATRAQQAERRVVVSGAELVQVLKGVSGISFLSVEG